MRETRLRNQENVKEECLHIRLTSEEKNFLWHKAEERGVNLSTYVKQRLFSEELQSLYNTQVSQQLYKITDLLVNQARLYCNDEKFIRACKREANELWHYLK